MMDEDTDKSDLDTVTEAIARVTAAMLEGALDDDARRGLLAELEILNGSGGRSSSARAQASNRG